MDINISSVHIFFTAGDYANSYMKNATIVSITDDLSRYYVWFQGSVLSVNVSDVGLIISDIYMTQNNLAPKETYSLVILDYSIFVG